MIQTAFTAVIAIVVGVGGAALLFFAGNWLSERLPENAERIVKPLVFVGPAIFVVGLFLVYPMVQTFIDTFRGDLVLGEREWVGLDNYSSVLTDPGTWSALINNALWVVFVPLGAVLIGLVVAVLADRLGTKGESVTKALIFLPMAISFVGASAIWTLVYAIEPSSRGQTGLLNAILSLFGAEPVAWLETTPFVNDFALMAIMVWLQAGFAMVLLSASIKNVPEDTLEAARIDGATELQIFFRVVVPQIASTIVVVATTILILVLKVFDIVRVLTNGRDDTDVIANLFYTKFELGDYGEAGVLVMILVLLTIPFMVLNVKRFREQEAQR